MKIKLIEAGAIYPLAESLINKKMPIKTVYGFTKIMEASRKEFNFIQETANKIAEEYGERDENGNLVRTEDNSGYMIKEDCRKEAGEKIKEFNEIEIDFPDVKFNLSDLDSLELTMSEMQVLMPFISE